MARAKELLRSSPILDGIAGRSHSGLGSADRVIDQRFEAGRVDYSSYPPSDPVDPESRPDFCKRVRSMSDRDFAVSVGTREGEFSKSLWDKEPAKAAGEESAEPHVQRTVAKAG